MDVGPVGAGVSLHWDKASKEFLGGGSSVGYGPSIGFSFGGFEICHDYLVYADRDYIKWVSEIGTFKPEMPADCCKEIQPISLNIQDPTTGEFRSGHKFYSGTGADADAFCCQQSTCKACPQGYITTIEEYGKNGDRATVDPGYCFGDFIEAKARWNNVCTWTGVISQASYAIAYVNGNDVGGTDKSAPHPAIAVLQRKARHFNRSVIQQLTFGRICSALPVLTLWPSGP